MPDTDYTLTSPLSAVCAHGAALLALTIVWHPERARIGAQCVVGGTDGGTDGIIELSRYAPLFMHPGREALGLGHGGISRQPLRLVRDAQDRVAVTLPASSMVVEVNGRIVKQALLFDKGEIAAGQIITLGRAVVLCLHWMDCVPQSNPVPGLIGVGSAAIGVRQQIQMVAPTGLPVLLLGETGSGKEIAARAIHALGQRAAAPLVAVNMAALYAPQAAAALFDPPAGGAHGALFAQAAGATLFLDEMGSAPSGVQPMLLRVLEGSDYRAAGVARDIAAPPRLIAASDQELELTGFNQALLRRLAGFVIRMPPLRARREDIGVLIVHLLAEQGAVVDMPVALVAQLALYAWPGNVRQLAHALQCATLMLRQGMVPALGQLVRVAHPGGSGAPPSDEPDGAPRRRLRSLSAQAILDAMVDSAWNIQDAAQSLGVSRPSMYKLLEEHPTIRRAELIPEEEIVRAMVASADDLARCAALLKTPAQALRRRWRLLRGA